MRPRIRSIAIAASALAVASVGFVAVPANAAARTATCIPIPLLWSCTTPSPSPTPSPSASTGSGSGGSPGSGSSSGSGSGSGSSGSAVTSGATPAPTPADAVANDTSTVFTSPAAQLQGSSISFSGLKGVTVVTVPLADGSRIPVLKLQADDIVITDFVLDVRKSADGDRGVTTSSRMELKGHVSCYVDSLSLTTADGQGITLGAQTPLPGDELPSSGLNVSLGLVGVESDSMTMTPSHLSVTAGS